MKVAGHVDADIARLLCEQLAGLAEADAPVELDLSEASFDAQLALSMIVAEVRSLIGRFDRLRVKSVDPEVRAHFIKAGLSRLLEPAAGSED